MIAVCVDSNAQLPPPLCDRHAITVIPLTIRVDGRDYLEGTELDADGFYAFFEGARRPEVATAAPSPGRCAAAYEHLAAHGATEIVSVHLGAGLSATFDAARMAAASSPVPVHLVDTGSASFVVGLAALAATEMIGCGGGAEDAVAAAEEVSAGCQNVFVVGTLDLARSGGRLDPAVAADEGVPVLRLDGATMTTLGTTSSAGQAARLMAEAILDAGPALRVGVGTSDRSSQPVGDRLQRLLDRSDADVEIIPYRIGPSVGVHTGPGTAGAVYHPRSR